MAVFFLFFFIFFSSHFFDIFLVRKLHSLSHACVHSVDEWNMRLAERDFLNDFFFVCARNGSRTAAAGAWHITCGRIDPFDVGPIGRHIRVGMCYASISMSRFLLMHSFFLSIVELINSFMVAHYFTLHYFELSLLFFGFSAFGLFGSMCAFFSFIDRRHLFRFFLSLVFLPQSDTVAKCWRLDWFP